jgi:hypothetical protein
MLIFPREYVPRDVGIRSAEQYGFRAQGWIWFQFYLLAELYLANIPTAGAYFAYRQVPFLYGYRQVFDVATGAHGQHSR